MLFLSIYNKVCHFLKSILPTMPWNLWSRIIFHYFWPPFILFSSDGFGIPDNIFLTAKFYKNNIFVNKRRSQFERLTADIVKIIWRLGAKVVLHLLKIFELYFHTLCRAYLNTCLCFGSTYICQPSWSWV